MQLLLLLLAAPAFSQSLVDVLDPEILSELDKPGVYSFATILGASTEENAQLNANARNANFQRLKLLRLSQFTANRNAKYLSLTQTISDDINEIKTLSGERMAYSTVHAEELDPAGNVSRHFDPYWFSSSRAAFPLIGVINRIDKKDFYPGTCGELRFIYRLAYYQNNSTDSQTRESRSTLPLFLNVVYDYLPDANGSCRNLAQSWIISASPCPSRHTTIQSRFVEKLT